MSLPRRPSRCSVLEGAHGLAVRLAEKNGLPDTRYVGQHLGFDHTRITSDKAVLAIAEACKVNAEELRRATVNFEQRQAAHLLGNILDPKQIGISFRRFCPQCLANGLFHAVCHDITAIAGCHIHGTLLHDRCSCCGSPIRWTSGYFHRCRNCNTVLSAAPSVPVTPVEAAADNYIFGRLQYKGPASAPFADKILLGDAIYILKKLGTAVLGGNRLLAPTPEELGVTQAQAIGEGLALVRDWDHKFPALLDELVRQSHDMPKEYGLEKGYGWVYSWSNYLKPTEFGRAITISMERHAANHLIVRGLTYRYDFISTPPRLYTLERAAEECGIGLNAMRTLCVQRGLFPRKPRRGITKGLEPADVQEMKEILSNSTDLKGATQILGIGGSKCAALIRAKLIVPLMKANVGGIGSHIIKLDEIQKFIKLMRGEATVKVTNTDQLRPLPIACKFNSIELTDACRLIAEGKLRPSALDPHGRGLQGILIDPQCILPLIREGRNWLVIAQVKERLGINASTCRLLLRHGFLKSDKEDFTTRENWKICGESLDTFERDYCKAREYAEQLGTVGKAAFSRLILLGARPIIDNFPEAISNFFRRDEVERILQGNRTRSIWSYDTRATFWMDVSRHLEFLYIRPLRVDKRAHVAFSAGRTDASISINYRIRSNCVSVYFLLRNMQTSAAAADIFWNNRSKIENEIGPNSIWTKSERAHLRIEIFNYDIELTDRTQWPELTKWAARTAEKLYTTMKIYMHKGRK